MSSPKLDHLIAEFPDDGESIKRLTNFIESAISTHEEKTLSANKLFDIANPKSQLVLLHVIERLVSYGFLQKIVRVESEGLGGIEDFSSIEEVPETLHDIRQDKDFQVRPEHLHLYYKVKA